MNLANQTTKERFLEEFRSWPEHAHDAFCFFYKAYRSQLKYLDFEDYVDIRYHYLKALFETNEYKSLHKEADEFLEELLNHQHFNEAHQEKYRNTIALKAQAALNAGQHDQAVVLYQVLYRMAEVPQAYEKRLFWLLFQRHSSKGKKMIGWVMVLLLGSLIINALIVFFINPFYQEHLPVAERIRNTIFVLGVLNFLILQGLYAGRAYRELSNLRKKQNLRTN